MATEIQIEDNPNITDPFGNMLGDENNAFWHIISPRIYDNYFANPECEDATQEFADAVERAMDKLDYLHSTLLSKLTEIQENGHVVGMRKMLL